MTVFNSDIFSRYLSDTETAALFSDENLIRQMLRVEAALAVAQGRFGVIPESAAAEIARILPALPTEPHLLAEGTAQNGTPVIPFLAWAKTNLSPQAADFLHWGATSQDIHDTAAVLQIRQALDLFEQRIRLIVKNLAEKIEAHPDTLAVARTRGQQAAPTLLALKIASWALPLVWHLERLEQMKPRLLVASLGGAAGNLAALGGKGLAVAEHFATELGLLFPTMPWHNQRDGIAEYAAWLTLVTGSLGKMGEDILTMSQTEIGEVNETGGAGGGSSAMPHKSNPVGSEALVALARFSASLSPTLFQSMLHRSERDGAAWLLEWMALPQMSIACGAALAHALRIGEHAIFDEKRLRENLERTNGLVFSELATCMLAQRMPRGEAQALVKKACGETINYKVQLHQALAKLTPELGIDWQSELQFERCLGASHELRGRVLAELKAVFEHCR